MHILLHALPILWLFVFVTIFSIGLSILLKLLHLRPSGIFTSNNEIIRQKGFINAGSHYVYGGKIGQVFFSAIKFTLLLSTPCLLSSFVITLGKLFEKIISLIDSAIAPIIYKLSKYILNSATSEKSAEFFLLNIQPFENKGFNIYRQL